MSLVGKFSEGLKVRAQKILEIHDYVEILWRCKWWVITPLILGAIVAGLYSFTIPPQYQSSSLIVVEAQQVSQDFVRSGIPVSISDRLNTLTQQILSRKNLEKVIRQFNLHHAVAVTPADDGLIDQIKAQVKAVLTSMGLHVPQPVVLSNPHAVPEQVIARFRENIDVQVVGRRSRRRGHEAISVSYSGGNPHKVMQITNALTRLFIEENLRSREEMVEGTTEFLNTQLGLAKEELERQERLLREFKEINRGALPEQMEANISKLDRLQAELKTVNEAMLKAEEKKILFERELREALALPNSGLRAGGGAAAVDPREVQLRSMQEELARLRSRFTESYPDIPVLRGQIQELEADLIARPPNRPVVTSPVTVPNPRSDIIQAQLRGQLELVEREMAALKQQQERIQQATQQYDKRVEQTFENEQKLADLTRDFQITHRNYQELLQKRLDAKLSEDMEKRQKGERFQILDSAYLPLSPYKPNRQEMIFFGAVLGGVLGVAVAFLLEYLGSSGFRKPDDLQDAFSLPLLGAIPSHAVSKQDYQLVSMKDPESLAAEQYRILYTKMDNARQDKSHKIFAISSALANEGKTCSTLNLAVVIARDFGKKIMLLEGDFKRPSLPLYLKTTMQGGLVDVLRGEADEPATLVPMADTMLPFAHENLSVLPAVESVRNSSNLLSSRRMKGLLEILKSQYDFILIDAPPVLPLSDMNLFREVVDGIILVVRADATPRRAVQQTMDMLGTDKIVGLVLNDIQHQYQPYYQYYGANAS